MAANGRNAISNWTPSTEVYFDEIANITAPIIGITSEQVKGLIQKPSTGDDVDLVIPVGALNKFQKLKDKPANMARIFAEKIAPELSNRNPKLVADVKSNDLGFIAFKIDKSVLVRSVLTEIFNQKDQYGRLTLGAGKTVLVEYSSPNIAKPFHAGHLRSTIIGNFIKNVHDALGYQVISINYLGDWGKQYGLLAVGFAKHGSEEALLKDPIKHLFDVYVEINKDAEADPTIHDQAREYFRRMEDGDPEALALWERFRSLSIERYITIYERLGVRFDVYSGESKFQLEMKEVLKTLKDKKLLEESNGALLLNLQKYKLNNCLVQKKDGSTLYFTRDIAAAISRYEQYKFDEMYYVVASAQGLHFKQLFKTLDLMGFEWANRCKHVDFGLVKGMSTRKGTVVFLENILDEARDFNHQIMQKNEAKFKEIENPLQVSDIVGLSAVIIQDLRAKRIKDYDFDWDRMLAEHGDTGPYIQYAHVRMASIERQCSDVTLTADVDFSLLSEPQAQDLVYLLSDFSIVIYQAKVTLEPSCVVTYAMKLCRLFSSCVDALRVKGSPQPLAEARLLLIWATRQVLRSCLKMLGLTPLERM